MKIRCHIQGLSPQPTARHHKTKSKAPQPKVSEQQIAQLSKLPSETKRMMIEQEKLLTIHQAERGHSGDLEQPKRPTAMPAAKRPRLTRSPLRCMPKPAS